MATRTTRPGPETDPGYPALKAAVIARTGHHYYRDKDGLLFDRLYRRFKACGLTDAGAYLAHLSGPETGPPEWAALESEITIGETFFFRYAEQFAALRRTILPGLIAARAQSRTLRIWSAGCSTGAEPHSIAILLHDLLGQDLPTWRIAITGTDISDAALAVARSGTYGRWALRTLPVEDQERFFVTGPGAPGASRDGSFTLRPHFRRMVTFENQNLLGLLDDGLPRFSDVDLILCRNVLIYFEARVVFDLVNAFGRRLKPDGWLLLGHAEPNPSFCEILDPVNLPGTVAYRPRGAMPAEPEGTPQHAVIAPTPWRPLPAPPAPVRVESTWVSPVRAHPEPASPPPPRTDPLDRIRTLADTGAVAEAWRAVRTALVEGPTQPALHYYDGLLAWSLGREVEAERALRGAIYLDGDFVMAHYQLGLLLTGVGRREAAARSLDNAVRIARRLAAEDEVPEGDGLRAGQLVATAILARDGLREDAT
ncbi:protein-glutamate O-methyltransferase CheR [Methylobacterium sp. Leaf108]|uniref:CheR family methyltransferase n=1 Tax=Methylobacterium sp. Leaf108 TaxID=1736256 RepID=UPI0006FEAD7E|nr:protein-glutamate O-methyltransferase CheR [Methylobacterium sp. Leaf108]KQP58813.1 protein-glutamate methyltransferase [Methylobacterium sp. Leaf108]